MRTHAAGVTGYRLLAQVGYKDATASKNLDPSPNQSIYFFNSFFSSSTFCYLYQFLFIEHILLPVSVFFHRKHFVFVFATCISFFLSRTFCYLYQFLFIENILLPVSVSFHREHFATCISFFSSSTFCYLYQSIFIGNILLPVSVSFHREHWLSLVWHHEIFRIC